MQLGGGVDNGGTIHAGHAQWSSTTTPWPQYKNLPPCPNPSTYAQISNVIPGPPQLPPRPGRFPEYVFTNPDQEKQGTYHPVLIPPKVTSEAIIPPLDPAYDEKMKAFSDAKSKRDLITGPFGHDYSVTAHPEIYTSDQQIIPVAWSGNAQSINSQFPPSTDREQRTARSQTSQLPTAPSLSFSQYKSSSLLETETDRTVGLINGDCITVPSIYEAQLRSNDFSSPLPPDPGFIADLHYQINYLQSLLNQSIQTYLASQTIERLPHQESTLLSSLNSITQFLALLNQPTKPITTLIRKAPSMDPTNLTTQITSTTNQLFNQIYQSIPPVSIAPDTMEYTGLPNSENEPLPASTTRSLTSNQPSLSQINAQLSSGLRYTVPEYVITTSNPIQSIQGHRPINSSKSKPTPIQRLTNAAKLNPSILHMDASHINYSDRLSQLSGTMT
jgi:hypothetical protein